MRTAMYAEPGILGLSAMVVPAFVPQTPENGRPIVTVKYRSGATDAQIQQVTDVFRALPDQRRVVDGRCVVDSALED